MKGRAWFVVLAFLVAAGAGALWASSLAQAAPAEVGENLLFNPSFEGYNDYRPYVPPGGHPDCPWGECGTALMAPGWTPYWRSHNPADPEHIIAMPEYKPADSVWTDPKRVRTGTAAQAYFTFWRTHEAGFYQQVSVTAGEAYCFSIWGHSWSAKDSPGEDGGDAYSGPDYGNFRQRVGINPTGGTDWQSSDIVWGPLRLQYDFYEPFVVTATAESDTITVYAYSQPEWAMKHNDAYWDDANLRRVEPVLPDGPLSLVTGVDLPTSMTKTINANWLCDPETSWEVSLNPDGTLSPELSKTNGITGEALSVTLDTEGLAAGTYETALHFSSPESSLAVATIPVSIRVLPYDNHVFLPIMLTGH
ncbi:MAG: hypothetical protein RRC07_05785 [Anaerolineae bacterium]|nr:hypothetical protein [Anaerolineae bacterium]